MTHPPRRRLRRLRWLAVCLGLLVALLVFVLGAGWLYATSELGSQWVRGKALTAINGSIAGRLEAGPLHIGADFQLVFEDLKLFTPEGELVAELAKATLDPKVWALTEGKVKLSHARLERLRLHLKTDERGLNLSRAIAGRQVSSGTPPRLDLTVEELALVDSSLDSVNGEQQLSFDKLHLEGRVAVKLPELELGGSLHLGGRLVAPYEDTINLDLVSRNAKAGGWELQVAAATTYSRLKATVSPRTLKAEIEELWVTPRLVRAFAPGFKLLVPISAKGTASPAAIDLQVSAGAARLTVKGNFHEGVLMDEVQLEANGLDLSELVEGGRPSLLEAHLQGRLNDARLGTLDGTVAGTAKWSEGGKVLAEAQLDVRAVKGEVEVTALKAKFPGATADIHGTGTSSLVALTGTVDATDLHAVAVGIGELTGSEPPQLSGAGRLAIIARGPLLHPWLAVDGTFSEFGFNSLEISDLRIDAQLADLRRPLEAQGTLKAKRLRVGQTEFQSVAADVTTEGRHLMARVTTQKTNKLELSLQLEGMLDRGEEGVLLSVVTLEYPPERWVLDAPSHISWKGGDVALEPFGLTSRDSHLTLEGGVQSNVVDLSLALRGLDLARLPAALVPPSLKLAGRVDAKVHATGKTSRVEADAELSWADGAIEGFTGIAMTAQAHAGAESVAGTLTLKAPVATVAGTFDVPFGGKSKGKAVAPPLKVHLTAQQLELARLAQALDTVLPFEGAVDLTLDVAGSLDEPLPMLHAESTNLGWCRGPCPVTGERPPAVKPDRVVLVASPDPQGHATASLAVTGLGGLTTLSAKMPKTFRQLPGIDWLRTPVDFRLEGRAVELAALGAMAELTVPLNGKLSLTAQSTGTLSQPDVELTASVEGFQPLELQPADLLTHVKSTRDETRVDLTVTRAKRVMTTSQARLGGPLETLWHPDLLPNTGLLVDAEVGPMPLADLWQVASDIHEQPPTGTVNAHLSITGSAANPRGSMRGTLEQLTVGKVALGHANLAWDYQAGKHVLSTAISSLGTFKGHGEMLLDISLPALIRGPNVAEAPIEATVKADRFDLSFLSGVHPMLRTLGGRLQLDAEFKGVLSNPGFKGELEWTEGRLGLSGYGEYKQVHLLLSGSDAGYLLKDLSAHAGGGEVTLKAEAKRLSAGVYGLTAASTMRAFPIITDDQLLAIATTRFDLEGQASKTLIDIKRFTIPEAHIELPDVKRKNLQALERPGDIILVRNGVPLVKKKKKPVPGAPVVTQAARLLRVEVDAPGNLFVKSSDGSLELGLSDKFRIEFAEQLLIYGEVSVVHGRLDVIGRRFDVQKDSRVRFAGLATTPYVNVTAVHVNQREGVTVFVTVVGHGTDYSLKTSSQPPLPDSEIFTLLTTGRRSLKLGGGSSSISAGDAASILGSLAASQLKTLISKRLPLDVLSVEAGKDGIATTKIEAGVYLTDRVYLGSQVQLGANERKGESLFTGRIEYQMSKSWSLEATAGTAPAAGAEFVWSREY